MSEIDTTRYKVIVVDDEPDQLEAFRLNFRKDFELHLASSGSEGLEMLEQGDAAVLLTDQRMPGMTGVEVLVQAKEIRPDTVRMVVTAYKDADSVLDAVNKGDVYRYVVKPWNADELRITITNAIERFELIRENQRLIKKLKAVNAYLEKEIQAEYDFEGIVGINGGLKETFENLQKVAPTRSTVLVRGETGTGKELVARAIHYSSPRAGKPMVKVNCAALTETLLASELFGHEKGAFTGADRLKPGRFELADGGTLFLDEIGDITLAMQTKLLRVLQEREFERVGGIETIKVDVRLIAATHRNLEEMVQKGEFREDLYFRLNVFPLEIPPLRRRKDDVPELARYFLKRHAKEAGRIQLKGFAADAMARLVSYPWPGNVRELENVIERSLVLADSTELDVHELPPLGGNGAAGGLAGFDTGSEAELPMGGLDLTQAVEGIEERLLRQALEQADGVKAEAARLLGLKASALYYKLEKYGIEA